MKGNFFYAQLAKSNIQRNKRYFFPYWLSCMVVVAFFFNLANLRDIIRYSEKVYGNTTVAGFLTFGIVIVGVLAAIFIFYANSFLMKNRKKELGLYGILGLEKRHVAVMLFLEMLMVAGTSVFAGLVSGMVFGKLLFMLMQKIIRYNVNMNYGIYGQAVLYTVVFYGILFLLVLMFNLISMHLTEPIELLKSKNQGEKKVRFLYFYAAVGVVCLAAGYYIAISVQNPLRAIMFFFWAVLLVIVATHYLFLAGSVVTLNLLKKSKRFYYKPTNFISTSALIYRMKKNAAGLANICILSCMVMVTVASTATVYNSMEKMIEVESPAAYTKSWTYEKDRDRLAIYHGLLQEYTEKAGVTATNVYDFKEIEFMSKVEGNHLLRQVMEYSVFADESIADYIYVKGMTQADFAKVSGQPLSQELVAGEIAITSLKEQSNLTDLKVKDKSYKVKENLKDDFASELVSARTVGGLDAMILVVADEEELSSFIHQQDEVREQIFQTLAFDLEGSPEAIEKFNELTIASRNTKDIDKDFRLNIKENNRKEMYSLNGGLYFIGIFLGSLFLLLTVLIIYFKQISEGEEDREHFAILKKIGLSSKEAKQVIRKQLLMMFFLPLVTAIIHVSVATIIISRLMMVGFGIGIKVLLPYMVGTMGVFAIIYFIVYLWTSRTYYQIVHGNGVAH